MKKLFALGFCALFIACSGTAEKAPDGTAADLTTTASNPTVTGVAATDTTKTAPAADTVKAVTPAAGTPAAAASPATAPVKAPVADKPSAKKGEALIATLDCTVCHKPTVKIIGPAFNEISKKYPATEANVSALADKVIKGGAGVWGQVPMSPHPQISVDDAKSLVLYVLSFK